MSEDFERIFARIDRRLVVILWMLRLCLALNVLVLGKLFLK